MGKGVITQKSPVRRRKNNPINTPKAFIGKVLFDFNRYEF
jgi:hypothetical protein